MEIKNQPWVNFHAYCQQAFRIYIFSSKTYCLPQPNPIPCTEPEKKMEIHGLRSYKSKRDPEGEGLKALTRLEEISIPVQAMKTSELFRIHQSPATADTLIGTVEPAPGPQEFSSAVMLSITYDFLCTSHPV